MWGSGHDVLSPTINRRYYFRQLNICHPLLSSIQYLGINFHQMETWFEMASNLRLFLFVFSVLHGARAGVQTLADPICYVRETLPDGSLIYIQSECRNVLHQYHTVAFDSVADFELSELLKDLYNPISVTESTTFKTESSKSTVFLDTSENTTPAVTKPFIPTSSMDPNTQEVTSHDVRESTPSSSMERQQSDTSENTRSAVTKPFTPTSSLDPNTQEVTSHDVRESTPSSSMERQQSDTSENTRSAVTKPSIPTSPLDPNTQEVTSHDVRASTPSSSMGRQQSVTTMGSVSRETSTTRMINVKTTSDGATTQQEKLVSTTPVVTEAICESIESDEDDFLVTSPGFPLNYADDIYCTYHIYAPQKNVVRLTFTSFDVDCDGDLLKIYDGDILGPASTSQHCNNNLPSDMISTRGEVTLVFTTDSQTNGQGFQASFEYVSNNPCDVTYTDDKSVITSPEYPSVRQTVEQTCVNWIQAPDGKVIEITFTAFSISERRRDDYATVGFTPAFDWINVGETKTCPYNKITIYDGNDDSHPFETPLCGPSPPPAFKTTGNFMYLSYYSDGTIDDGLYYATFQFLDS
ncbi:uncharacterized protein [Apostichopus japonicus]|uniref:uncharacterized protein n=1 Tax=Stichopus japonicus TaxID=307972 RepID=UPI003AB6250B